MAGAGRIPRSRGSACGVLLILLGAWGGLIPFVGPYFHYAFTPDRAWAYTTGRLYLEVVPGAVVLIGGLIVLAARSRAVGGLAAFLAVLGGAWFIAGIGVIEVWGTSLGNVSPGVPVATSATKSLLEALGFFTGLGVVIVFFGALALGRFSMIAAKDAADDGSAADYQEYQGGPGQRPAPAPGHPAGQDQFPTTAGQLPTTSGQFPASQPEHEAGLAPFPAGSDQFPTSSGQFPTSSGQFPPPAQEQRFPGPSTQYPPPADQFPTSAS
jgi:hypothetical protein